MKRLDFVERCMLPATFQSKSAESRLYSYRYSPDGHLHMQHRRLMLQNARAYGSAASS